MNRRRFLGLAVAGGVGLTEVGVLARTARALVAPVLSVGTVTQTSVDLSWTDGGNEQSYRVYKNSALLATLGANVLTYRAINLTPNTPYVFQVGAKKGNTELKSNTQSVTTLPATGGGDIYSDIYGMAA